MRSGFDHTNQQTYLKKPLQKGTIDLTFIQKVFVGQLAFCGPENTWAITTDHIPIWIVFNITTPTQQTCQRYATKKFNQKKYTQEIANRLADTPQAIIKDI